MEPSALGRLVVVVGLGIAAIGFLIWSGALSWFGKLPGDIRYEGEGTRVYFPLSSMLLISLVVTVLVNLFGRFFR